MKPTPFGAALLALCACSGITRDDDRRVSGTIVLSSNEVGALAQPGPFISVIDRIDIRATNTDGEIVAQTGFQLQRYDSTASATLEVSEGSTTFTVEVSSASGIVLYSGSATAVVADGFEIDVPLIAVRPVLVIQPDTVRTTGGVGRFIVYNGGIQTLDWSINNPGTCTLGGVCPFPTAGHLTAGQSTSFTATLPANTPSGNYSLVVSSTEGSVSPVWAYTRPNVIGFSVSPESTAVAFGFQVQLTATTQSGPSNASWTSGDTRIATVTTTGLVTGVGLGTVWVHAVSQVVPTVRDSSRVFVHSFVGRLRGNGDP